MSDQQTIYIRLPKTHHDLAKRLARELGMSFSEFARFAFRCGFEAASKHIGAIDELRDAAAGLEAETSQAAS